MKTNQILATSKQLCEKTKMDGQEKRAVSRRYGFNHIRRCYIFVVQQIKDGRILQIIRG